MDINLYPIACVWDDEARAWSVLSPDFPEIASFATAQADLARTARDAVWTAIEARNEDGTALPEPHAEPWLLTKDWPYPTRNIVLHVPVPVELEAVRVNVSFDRALLERIDAAAAAAGMTRSGFLSMSAKARLNA